MTQPSRKTGRTGTEPLLRDLLRQLADFEMGEIVTTRMLPLIYRFAVLGMGALVVLGILTAFIQSPWMGLAWLIFGPIVFLILVVIVRVLLEFVMAVFRLLVLVETLDERTSTIQLHTDEVVRDLPRIRFWKRRVSRTPESEAPEEPKT